MNARVYDIANLVGVALIAGGVYTDWGLPPALITTGTLILGLTLIGAWLARRR